MENSLRASKGKPLAESLDHLEELNEAEQEAKEAEEEATSDNADLADANTKPAVKEETDEIEAAEDDAMLEEAGRILLDLIGLSIQVAQVEHLPESPALSQSSSRSSTAAVERKDG